VQVNATFRFCISTYADAEQYLTIGISLPAINDVYADVSARTARVLMLMVIPGQGIFMLAIYLVQKQSDKMEITPMFAVVYLTAAIIQVSWWAHSAVYNVFFCPW
jgi:hypothetical protein